MVSCRSLETSDRSADIEKRKNLPFFQSMQKFVTFVTFVTVEEQNVREGHRKAPYGGDT